MWVYLIELKSEVFTQFKKFKLQVEKQSGCKLQKLRIDGGDEYTSIEFETFYTNEVIEHEFIAPYTPNHNGITKRRNKSILNMTRGILKVKEVPNRFLGEASSMAVYILNK